MRCTESGFKVSFTNRLNLQRNILPDVRIERQCPWMFPSTSAQRLEALNGGARGSYSPLHRCGYSPDQTGGVGNLNSGAVFTTCDLTRANCVARGMFDTDSASNVTRRFGGLEFVPPQILVRSFGEQGTQLSPLIDNLALYNDFVPLVCCGTVWCQATDRVRPQRRESDAHGSAAGNESDSRRGHGGCERYRDSCGNRRRGT